MRHSTVQTRSFSHRHPALATWQSAAHIALAAAAFVFVGAVTFGLL